MSGLTKAGVWILLVVVLLLPLYELADYSEVWQHDSDLATCGLFFLFAGMALLAGKKLHNVMIDIAQAFIELVHLLAGLPPARDMLSEVPIGPPRINFSPSCVSLRI